MEKHVVMKMAIVVVAILTSALSAAADGIEGYWCRNVDGAVGDVISITGSGELFKVNLREGWNRPIYSEGVGNMNCNNFTATLRSKAQPNTIIHSIMAFSGDSLSYSSFNMDGGFRWKGSYYRCHK